MFESQLVFAQEPCVIVQYGDLAVPNRCLLLHCEQNEEQRIGTVADPHAKVLLY